MTNKARHDAGSSKGGQFAPMGRAESDLDLADGFEHSEPTPTENLRRRLSEMESSEHIDLDTITVADGQPHFTVRVIDRFCDRGRFYRPGDTLAMDKVNLEIVAPPEVKRSWAAQMLVGRTQHSAEVDRAAAEVDAVDHPFYGDVDPKTIRDVTRDEHGAPCFTAEATRDFVINGNLTRAGEPVEFRGYQTAVLPEAPDVADVDPRAASLNRSGWDRDGRWDEDHDFGARTGTEPGRYEARSLAGGFLHTNDLSEAVAFIEGGNSIGSVADFGSSTGTRPQRSISFDARFLNFPTPMEYLR